MPALRVGRSRREKFARERECVLAGAERFTATSRVLLPRVAVVGIARPVTGGWWGGGGTAGAAGQP